MISMKLKHLFILMTLASCQKEQKITQPANFNSIGAPKTIAANTKAIEESSLRTDTIILSEDKNEYILANLTDQKADKDSIVTSKFRLDFYQNKNKAVSSKIKSKDMKKDQNGVGLTVYPIHLKTIPLL